MPQNSYSNKDLSRFERKPSRPEDMEVLSEVPRDDVAAMASEPSVEALLAQARGSLDRANQFAAETGSADIARIPQRLENLKGHAFEELTPIDMMYSGGDVPMAASMIPTPASPVLAAIAGLLKAPKAAQSYLEGDTGQAALEGLESAFVGAPGPIFGAIGKGVRGAKNLVGQGVEAIRNPLGKAIPEAKGAYSILGKRAEVPYASTQRATNPNQTLEVARDVAGESGDDLGKVLKQGGTSKESAAALLRLAGSGAEGRGAQAVRAGQAQASLNAPFERAGIPQRSGLDPADFLGDRSTGTGFQTPQIFLDDVAGKNRYPAPGRYMSEVDDLVAGLDETPFDVVDDLVGQQVQPNARDVDMLVSGALPQQETARASQYALDPYKRRVPSRTSHQATTTPRGSRTAAEENPISGDYKRKQQKRAAARKRDMKPGQMKQQLSQSLKSLLPMSDDVVNAGYRSATGE